MDVDFQVKTVQEFEVFYVIKKVKYLIVKKMALAPKCYKK